MESIFFMVDGVNEIRSAIESILKMASVVFVFMGLAECMFGYVIYRIMNVVKGFVVFGLAGAVLGGIAMIDQINVGIVIGGLIGGLIGALLANALIMFMVFFESFIIGVLLGVVLGAATGSYDAIPICGVIVGLLLAILSCLLFKHMIIFNTALHGAVSCGIGIFCMSGSYLFTIGSMLVLFAIGIMIQQWRLNRTEKNSAGWNNVQKKYNEYFKTQVATENQDVVGSLSVAQEKVQNAKAMNVEAQYIEPQNIEISSSNAQKSLRNLFSQDIYEEIFQVFAQTDSKMIRVFPTYHEDGTWTCTCGNNNLDSSCTFCGMKKQDLQDKLNYEYLSEHWKKRREQEEREREEKRKKQQEELQQKKEKLVSTMKDGVNGGKSIAKQVQEKIISHKKLLITLAVIVACAGGGFTIFTHNNFCMMNYYNLRGDLAQEKADKYSYYKMALSRKENLKSYINLIELEIECGDIASAAAMNSAAKECYGHEKEYQEFEQLLYPKEPHFVTEQGKYDKRFTIELENEEEEYNPVIRYIINNGVETDYEGLITITKSGEYDICAWTENAFGYRSEEIESTYIAEIYIPDTVVASVEAGSYTQSQNVELSQNNNDVIYYTVDGTIPDKSSLVYAEPIKCDFGMTQVKAISYSKDGESSEVMDETYYVSYEDHESQNGFSGYYNDYVCIFGRIEVVDKHNGEIKKTIYGGTYPNEAGENLYYIDSNSGNIMTCDQKMESENSSIHMENVNAKELLITQGLLYYIDSNNQLFKANLDGSDRQLVADYAYGISKTDDRLYYCNGQNIYCIESKYIQIADNIFVYLNTYGLYLSKDGVVSELVKNAEDYSSYHTNKILSQKIEDINRSFGSDVLVCNNSLVYATTYTSEHNEYSWANESVVSSSENYSVTQWACYDVSRDTAVGLGNADYLFMADEVYYCNDERILFEH